MLNHNQAQSNLWPGSALQPELLEGAHPGFPDTDFLDFEKRFFSGDPEQITSNEVATFYHDVTKRTPHDVYLNAAVAALSRLSPDELHRFEHTVVFHAKSQLLKTNPGDTLPAGFVDKTATLANTLFHLQKQRPAFLSQLLASGNEPQELLRGILAGIVIHAVHKAMQSTSPDLPQTLAKGA